MKKSLLWMALVCMFFAGCNDDDQDKDYLKGTTWEGVDEYTYEGEGGKDVYLIRFDKKDFHMTITAYYKENNEVKSETEEERGTYTYNPPVAALTFTEDGATTYTETFKVDGKTMTWGDEGSSDIVVFHKK